MPCENCLNRREFLARTAGGAAIAAIVACGDGQLSGPNSVTRIPPGGGNSGPVTIKVGDFPNLAAVDRLIAVPQSFFAVKRTAISPPAFQAFSMACTHAGCLTDIVNAQRFDCPCHGSRFDVNGAVINGPFTGESIGPLQKIATSYDPATDKLTIG
jgi:Rieske Fe-S protein